MYARPLPLIGNVYMCTVPMCTRVQNLKKNILLSFPLVHKGFEIVTSSKFLVANLLAQVAV